MINAKLRAVVTSGWEERRKTLEGGCKGLGHQTPQLPVVFGVLIWVGTWVLLFPHPFGVSNIFHNNFKKSKTSAQQCVE